MSEWQEYQLDKVIEKFIDYRGKTPNKVSSGIPLITAKVIKDGTILPPDEFIEPGEYSSWMTRGLPKVNDVLLTTEAPLGEVALIQDENIALAQRIILLRGNPKLVDNKFLFYALQTRLMKHRLAARASGSTVQGIKSAELKKVLVPLPDVDTQKEIVQTLSCLDRKIENLRKQNETLEAIAQTLYKHWFIDFEFPNADGKPYKSSGGEMERSELGEIPADWRIGTLEECLEHLIDNRGKTPEFFDSGIPALSAKFVKGGDLVNRDNFNYVSHNLFEQSEKLRIGDVILTSEAPLGETYFIARETRYYPAQRVFALRANKNIITCSYLNYWLSSPTGQFFLKRRGSGSTVQGIKQSELYQCEVIVPDRKVQDRVSGVLTEILNKKELNSDQIQTLIKTRDVLLPKLMSGQLRVTP